MPRQTIRQEVWETNSSSIHTLAVKSRPCSFSEVKEKIPGELLRWIKTEGLNIGRKCNDPEFKYPSSEIEGFEDRLTETFYRTIESNSEVDYQTLVFFSDLAEKLGVGLIFKANELSELDWGSWSSDCYSMAGLIKGSNEREDTLASFLRFLVLPEEVIVYDSVRGEPRDIPGDFVEVLFSDDY